MHLTHLAAFYLSISITAEACGNGAVFVDQFDVDVHDLNTTGSNPFFILEPGYQLVLESDDGRNRLTITVLEETRTIDGVETRVVEEREEEDGNLVEVSRNYFAINAPAGDVYYFGEDVDIYREGKVVDHEGSWLSGTNGARFGLMMSGQPVVGSRYYQEIAPRVAMDRASVVDVDAIVQTPAGRFTGVLTVAETTPLEPLTKEYKYYARSVGLLQDGDLLLTRFTRKTAAP